tara:strand:+ start:1033 stop:1209 length:177 start_codon:yes stop_codon:yes gene_type:complete
MNWLNNPRPNKIGTYEVRLESNNKLVAKFRLKGTANAFIIKNARTYVGDKLILKKVQK